MGTATKHTVVATVVAWVFAAGIACADTVEMFPCGLLGRTATVEPSGLVIERQTPADVARAYMKHCDFVALGRFSSITVDDYATTTTGTVVALFVVDESLLGVERTSVKIRVSGAMLVQPGETINRGTAGQVYRHDESLARSSYVIVVEDLHDLRQGKITLTDVLPGLERNIERLGARLGPIDRATELRFAHSSYIPPISTFDHEGGAIHPDTQFLLGLDTVDRWGHERLRPHYTLLHWGDYAVEVAGAIRAAAE